MAYTPKQQEWAHVVNRLYNFSRKKEVYQNVRFAHDTVSMIPLFDHRWTHLAYWMEWRRFQLVTSYTAITLFQRWRLRGHAELRKKSVRTRQKKVYLRFFLSKKFSLFEFETVFSPYCDLNWHLTVLSSMSELTPFLSLIYHSALTGLPRIGRKLLLASSKRMKLFLQRLR